MKNFFRSQYASVIAVTAISLSAYYWTLSHTNKSLRNRTLVSSLGNVPYSSGINLNKQIFVKGPERSISSIGGLSHKVEAFSKGDINGDGIISFLDLQYAEVTKYGEIVKEDRKNKVLSACDINKDKKCNQKDLDILSKKYIVLSGDVNGDGKLSDADLVLAQRIIEKKEEANTRLRLMKMAFNGKPDEIATEKDLAALDKKLSK